MSTIHITKGEFLERVADYESNPNEWSYLGDKPAIVDFYASWCSHCRAISPLLDQLSEEFKDRIYIYKVDVDKEQELSDKFGVKSVPTLYFVPMVGKPYPFQGSMPKDLLLEKINDLLLSVGK